MGRDRHKLLGWTREELYAIPDDGARYEIVAGYLLREPPPVPAHQVVVTRLFAQMLPQLGPGDVDFLLTSPIALVLSRDTVLQPDLLYLGPGSRHAVRAAEVGGPPDLVVEILSPSSRSRDLLIKRLAYARAGIGEYWVLDPPHGCLYVFTAPRDGDYAAWSEHRAPAAVVTPGGWRLDLGALFGAVAPGRRPPRPTRP